MNFKSLLVDYSEESANQASKWPPPASSYKDRILKPGWLNTVMLRSNMFYAHLYRNFINATLLSRRTQEIKRMQVKEAAERSSELGEEEKRVGLRVPTITRWLFAYIMFIEIFLIIRFSLITYYLSEKYPKQTLITASEPAGSLKYESLRFKQHVNLTSEAASLLQARSGDTQWGQQLSCLQRLEAYLNSQFNSFYLWEASPGLDRRNGSSLLFNNERGRFQTIIEESYSIQIIRKETKVYCYLVACFITSCFVGSLVSSRIPYDVTPLVLIYDPELVAFTIQVRVKRYLELMRRSYFNYWSARHYDHTDRIEERHKRGSEPTCNCSLQVTSELDCAVSGPLANDCHRDEQFATYMPTMRSQGWRRLLMILHPLGHYLILSGVVCTLLILWIMFVSMNSNTISSNHQLKMILEGNPSEKVWSRLTPSCRNKLNESIRLDSVRRILVRGYADSLRRHNPAAYEMKLESYLNWSFPGKRRDMLPEQRHIDLQLIANSLAPISLPHFVYWIWPFASALLPCLLTSLYVFILALTLADLCFWLVELRVKLNICAVILKYQTYARSVQSELDSSLEDLTTSQFSGSNLHLVRLPHKSNRTSSSLRARQSFGSAQMRHSKTLPPNERRFKEETLRAGERGDFCNVPLSQIFTYLLANRSQKRHICEQFAHRLIGLELAHSDATHSRSDKFLISTYLDFRLFLDQIDDCRNSINFFIGYCVLHSLNIVASSLTLTGIRIQFGFVAAAYSLANLGLVGGGFFLSQCSKLYAPIHSILALSLGGDRVVLHLAALWRRALVDLCGSRSKLSFRVYSLNISYALALQFNLSISSLYIIILDRNEF